MSDNTDKLITAEDVNTKMQYQKIDTSPNMYIIITIAQYPNQRIMSLNEK